MSPVLAVHSLAAGRGGRLLFRDLSFQLHAGEQLLLKGANGSGKTTLLRLVLGLGRPAAGRIAGPKPQAVLYLGHRNAHKPLLTALENLLFDATGRAAKPQEAQRALQTAGLAELTQAPAASLSAGQLRRLALARLLLHSAALWVLDEPLSSLDAPAQTFWAQQFAHFCNRGGAILMTAHDLAAPDRPPPAQRQMHLSSLRGAK